MCCGSSVFPDPYFGSLARGYGQGTSTNTNSLSATDGIVKTPFPDIYAPSRSPILVPLISTFPLETTR